MKTALAILIAFAVFCGVMAWLTTGALSHDALPTAGQPLGWKYPFSCCAGFDCKDVDASEAPETPRGFRVKSSGIEILHGSPKLKDSPDGRVHLCCKGGDFGKCQPICLFIPPRGF